MLRGRGPEMPSRSSDSVTDRLVQARESVLAERVLRTALLSAAGAEFALGPLEGLGEVFRKATLLLRCRKSLTGYPPSGAVWLPPEQGQSNH